MMSDRFGAMRAWDWRNVRMPTIAQLIDCKFYLSAARNRLGGVAYSARRDTLNLMT
jgi:hypothetical protein